MLQRIIPFLFVFMSMSVYAQTTVTITSDKEYITESESLNITATLNAISASDVTVNFTFTGTATAAVDYTTMAGPFTVAGSSDAVAGATASLLDAPYGLYLDAAGNIYIADQANHRVQKWAPDATEGVTVAGGNGSGDATNQLSSPSDVFVDASGNIYITDTDNHRVQKWASGASVGTTVAGGNGSGSALNQFNTPRGVFVDLADNVYVSDQSNHRVQMWASGASVGTTVAGGNGVGSATNQLSNPIGIFVDGSGSLFIADATNHRIQKWASGASVGTTVAGGNGSGDASNQLNMPFFVYVDLSESVFISDVLNHRAQKWLSGATEGITVAGGNGQGASSNQFDFPAGIFVDTSEKIYVADKNNNRVQQNQFSPSIIIEAGQLSGSLQVEGIVDAVSEGNETIIVDVASVVNATLVEPSQQNLTIVCTAAPTAEQTQTFCNSALVSDLTAIGDNIQWYAAASGGTALLESGSIADETSYFATQTIDACESLERFEVAVVINTPSAPTGDASQSFIDSGIISDLEATGSNIQWYAAASGGSALAGTTSLVDGISYYATQTISGCESASRLEVVATIVPYTSSNWVGGADNDWNNAANWSPASVPGASNNVTIPLGFSITLSGSGSCHDLTIDGGAGLSISGTLTASGTVTVKSDADDSGSLIFTGTGSVENTAKRTLAAATITYERYVTAGRWHLISAPLDGQDISDMLTEAGNDIAYSDPNYSMKEYAEGSDAWGASFTSSTGGNMISGKGYAITRATDGIISMSGTQNGVVNYVLEQSVNGWNLLGNPYTSAVRASSGGLDDYLLNTSNIDEMDPVYAGIYVWEENISDPNNTNNYKIINNAKSGSLDQQTHIQAGQGFFVKAKASPSNFGFNIGMQEDESGVAFYKEAVDSWPTIKLRAETESAYATTIITYNSQMTKGLDVSYDAGLLNSYPAFALYSQLVEDNGYDFMIQALPVDYEDLVIPIGLDAKAGEIIHFSAQNSNIPEEYALILEDRVLDEFIDLSDENDKYTLQLSDDLGGLGRFFLYTRFKDALGLDALDTESNVQVFSRVDHNQIVIRGEFSSNAVARIFSISGKQLVTINLSQAEESTISFNEETGVYIIQITDAEKTITRKLSWVKQ